jgi:uncharacterized protein GlcG (DUF336 family)
LLDHCVSPYSNALNTAPEVLFVPGGVLLRTSDNTVIGGLGVSEPGGDKTRHVQLTLP